LGGNKRRGTKKKKKKKPNRAIKKKIAVLTNHQCGAGARERWGTHKRGQEADKYMKREEQAEKGKGLVMQRLGRGRTQEKDFVQKR